MRTITLKSCVFAHAEETCEFCRVITVNLPGPEDIVAWPRHVRDHALAHHAADEPFVRRHLAIGSTPPTDLDMSKRTRDRVVRQKLYEMFGKDYIVR